MEEAINRIQYLSSETREQFEYLSQQNYEKKEELQIHEIENGVVLPYDSSQNPPCGGVLSKGELDKYSLSTFYNPLFDNYAIRTGNLPAEIENIVFVDETVIYLGDVDSFFGHFLTNSLTRLWILFNPIYKNFKVCCIGPDSTSKFIDAYYLFGVKKENLVFIDRPTQFAKVIVPEPSYRYWDYWHRDYKKTFDQIRLNCKKKYNYPKIYLSRSTYFGASGTYGEVPIEETFRKQGFKIIHPENYSFTDIISLLANCKILAGLSGSAMHNILFCNDNITCYILNRSPCIMPVQIQIDKMKNINTFYIDAYLDILPTLDNAFPYLVGLNRNLELFFTNKQIKYSKQVFVNNLPRDIYNFLYYWNKQVIQSNYNYYIIKKYSPDVNMIELAKKAESAFLNYYPVNKETYVSKIKKVFTFPLRKIKNYIVNYFNN